MPIGVYESHSYPDNQLPHSQRLMNKPKKKKKKKKKKRKRKGSIRLRRHTAAAATANTSPSHLPFPLCGHAL